MNVGYFSQLEDGNIMFVLPNTMHKTMTREEAVNMVNGFKAMMEMIDAEKLVSQSWP
jgi:hypothetical protein